MGRTMGLVDAPGHVGVRVIADDLGARHKRRGPLVNFRFLETGGLSLWG